MGSQVFIIDGGVVDGHYKVMIASTGMPGYVNAQFIPSPVKVGDLVKLIYRGKGNTYFRTEKVRMPKALKQKIFEINKKFLAANEATKSVLEVTKETENV